MSIPQDLWEKLYPIVTEIAEINRKYNFRQDPRSPEDVARFNELVKMDRAIVEAYNAEHPTDPCPACGGKRPASLGGGCVAIARCKLAPFAAGE